MIDNVLLFILSYLGLIAMGSLAVGGWFFTTRGKATILPNGAIKKEGKVFKFVYFYFMEETGTEKIFYRVGQVTKLIEEMRATGLIPEGIGFNISYESGIVSTTWDGAKKFLYNYCKQVGVGFLDKGDGYFAFYKEYPVYRFPEWVRDPLVKCATCFSSFYGSLFYWTAYCFIGDHLFLWMQMPLAPVIFWIIFCFSLAIPLTALAKKYN